MKEKSIVEIANSFGLTVETVIIPDHDRAFKVYKGAKQLFVGTEEATRQFFTTYENDRPGLYEGSIYGYKE